MAEQGLDRLRGLVPTESRRDDRVDGAVRQAERRAKDAIGATAGGVLLEGLAVKAASFTAFPHGLGRKWKWYSLAGQTVDVRIFHENTGDDDRELRLKSSVDATVNVLVG